MQLLAQNRRFLIWHGFCKCNPHENKTEKSEQDYKSKNGSPVGGTEKRGGTQETKVFRPDLGPRLQENLQEHENSCPLLERYFAFGWQTSFCVRNSRQTHDKS